MNGILYGIGLQLKLDIRSKTMLITCYMVPLLFYLLMGGIFTSLMPQMRESLVQSMTVMGISMGAFIGLPQSVTEVYGGDMKKVYQANGAPVYFALVSIALSSLIHLYAMSLIIYISSPFIFESFVPDKPNLYFLSLAIFLAVSVTVGCVLGLLVKNQSKLTMISQIVFLPSIMLSGIMFSSDLLPYALKIIGKFFPASWGYNLMLNSGFSIKNLIPLLIIFLLAAIAISIMLKLKKRDI